MIIKYSFRLIGLVVTSLMLQNTACPLPLSAVVCQAASDIDRDKDGQEERARINIIEIRSLLRQKANVNGMGKGDGFPIYYAVQKNRLDIVKLLLEKDANVKVANQRDDITPLHLAAKANNVPIMLLLLEKKANMHAKATMGNLTPLELASMSGSTEAVALLLEKGACVHRDEALHGAAFAGHVEVAKLLLSGKADINARGSRGSTPLHTAASRGHKDFVIFLLRNNALKDLVTWGTQTANGGYLPGRTAFQMARSNNHYEVANLLR